VTSENTGGKPEARNSRRIGRWRRQLMIRDSETMLAVETGSDAVAVSLVVPLCYFLTIVATTQCVGACLETYYPQPLPPRLPTFW
jgi:hypothetical protein